MGKARVTIVVVCYCGSWIIPFLNSCSHLLCLLKSLQVMLETTAGETKLAALDYNLYACLMPHMKFITTAMVLLDVMKTKVIWKTSVHYIKWFDVCFVTVRFEISAWFLFWIQYQYMFIICSRLYWKQQLVRRIDRYANSQPAMPKQLIWLRVFKLSVTTKVHATTIRVGQLLVQLNSSYYVFGTTIFFPFCFSWYWLS